MLRLVVPVESRLMKSRQQNSTQGVRLVVNEDSCKIESKQSTTRWKNIEKSHQSTIVLQRGSRPSQKQVALLSKNNSRLQSKCENAIIEKLAEIEHDRWSGQARTALDKMDNERRTRWDKLSKTPYDKLTEEMKQKYRDQVYEYWPIIKSFILSMMGRKFKKSLTDLWVVPRSPGMSVENHSKKTFRVIDDKQSLFDTDEEQQKKQEKNNTELKIINKHRKKAVNHQIQQSRTSIDPVYAPEQMY
jgi:hypothetical protein